MPKGGKPDKGGPGGGGGDGGDTGAADGSVIDLGALAAKKNFKTYNFHPETGVLVPYFDYRNQNGPAEDMVVLGSSGSEMLYLDEANDTATMGDGADWVVGNLGDDNISGEGDRDILIGDFDGGWSTYDILGDDTLDGGEGDDVLWGDTYRTIANGTPPEGYPDVSGGNDSLIGGAGHDDIVGDSRTLDGVTGGDDTIIGGEGNDFMWGDAYELINEATGGADVFVFEDGSNDDVIFDFEVGKDILDLTGWSGNFVLDPTYTEPAGEGEPDFTGTLITHTWGDPGAEQTDTIFLLDVSISEYLIA
ncbi:hypothetical protein GQ651_07465 [Alphaproteobacteria bacterium GH1-50]|uniref:Hemolysin type calcium-binding protein n=1 Tax=Kangsaoukella pontilimi TaxID=2691042 RepID=A0A7C9J2P1_9RHOB|nr:calcium-binding protein [Kangsaoukella pontilimi]MXQ07681.1 hypothetical protein [Kangsaoukella pontilimi]